MSVEVRRVAATDWPTIKALRLEALQESPLAYCETYADAVRAPDATWQERAVRGAVGGDSFQVLGWAGERAVAMTVSRLEGDDAVLAAVYVAPSQRGCGVLAQMVEQAVQWAVAQGAGRLRLLVHEANPRAQRAYERLGFSLTGHREPYPLDPSSDELEMARSL